MRQRATPAELATAAGRNQAWVYSQAQDRKWGRRRPQKGSPGHKYANLEQDARAEGAARDRQLYGALIDDVKFLRSRDWGIHRDGTRIIVGNRPMEPESIRALAERERRIAGG